MIRPLLLLAAGLAVTAVSGAAHASVQPAPSTPPGPSAPQGTNLPIFAPVATDVAPSAPPFERRLLLGQWVAGVVMPAPVGLIALAFAIGNRGGAPFVLATTPLAVGAAVCAIGNKSDYYQGSYLATIAGAAIGAVVTVPLVIATADEHGGDAKTGNYLAATIVGGVGWLVLQPALAIAFYHGSKRLRDTPRDVRPLPPPSLDSGFTPGLSRGLSTLPGQVAVPLLSLSF